MYTVRGEDSRTLMRVLPTTTEADLMRDAELFEPRAWTESGGQHYEIMRVPDTLGNYNEGEKCHDPKAVALERLVDALFTESYMARGMVCPECRSDHILPLERTRFWSCSDCGFDGIGDEFEDTGLEGLDIEEGRLEAIVRRTIELVLAELTERRLILVRPEALAVLLPMVLGKLRCRGQIPCPDDAEKAMECPGCGYTSEFTELDNLHSIWMCKNCGYKGLADNFLQ